MGKKILIFLTVFIFAFFQVNVTYAKGSTGGRSGSVSSGSRSTPKSSGGYSGLSSSKSSAGSSGSSSSKSSAGSSGSSSSKSSGGYSGSSSSQNPGASSGGSSSSGSSSSSSKSSGGYTGSSSSTSSGSAAKSSAASDSSSRSVPSSNSAKTTSSKTETMKNSYMQDYYKQQTSKQNYNTYKQTLNNEQQKVYETANNTSYNYTRSMNLEDALRTRPSRINAYNARQIVVGVNPLYFSGPITYGSAYVGPWDLWFLMRASDIFWYHHWLEILPYRDYFDAAKFNEMEARIKNLEAGGLQRDPSYVDPEVDYDLQFSDDYQQKHLSNMYYTNKYSSPSGSPIVGIIVIIGIAVVLVIVIRKSSRPKPKKTINSRIY